jgi:UTP--glucose-1-phosphate uridylyltransferase
MSNTAPQVRKAVIPAAGFGTRFLPATKAQAKEMLPIVDKPVIQYVVEEAVASGIEDILLVIGKGKLAVEEHFSRSDDLEHRLAEKGDESTLAAMRALAEMANIHYVWQHDRNGLGGAVLRAKSYVGDEPFAVLLGDTITQGPRPVTKQLLDVYQQYGETVIGVQEIPADQVSAFGVVGGDEVAPDTFRITEMVEKPAVADAPSSMIIAGRYILPVGMFDALERTPSGKGGEIQLTDAIQLLLRERDGYALRMDGQRYDVGNKLDFIKTNLIFGLEREDTRADLRAFLRTLDV